MKRVSITKEFTWDMAHMLGGHEGLCKNLHGHTYKMQVEVCRIDGDVIKNCEASKSMVVDFKDLKNIVKAKIVEPLDHAFMYWNQSPDAAEHQIADILRSTGKKVVEVNFRPTAEEMAIDFFDQLSKDLEDCGLDVLCIRVWETPSSFAEVKKEK